MTHPNQPPNQLPPNQPLPPVPPGHYEVGGVLYEGTPQFQVHQPEPAPAGKPKRPKRFGWVAASLFALGGLTVGGLIGGGDSAPVAAPGPVPTVTETQLVVVPGDDAATRPPSPTQTKAPTKAPQPEVATTIGEGNYEVGVDVQAGRYKTSVADGDLCYWARNKDDSGDSIIANELQDGPARMSVTIKKGEFFETSGCGTWTKV